MSRRGLNFGLAPSGLRSFNSVALLLRGEEVAAWSGVDCACVDNRDEFSG